MDYMVNSHQKNIHKYDKEILNMAYNIALKSDMRCKHGCIIIDNKGVVVSSACNKAMPVCKEILYSQLIRPHCSIHAEELALRKSDYRKLSGAKMYVVRINSIEDNSDKSLYFMNSKPCNKCTYIINACIRKYGLKTVYYSDGNNIINF